MHKNYFHRCVEMGKEGHDPGEWSTRDCDIKSKFICEKPQTVPTKGKGKLKLKLSRAFI